MSDLLKEFEDDFRREQAGALWQRLGKFMVLLSLAVVAGTAASVMWQDHKKTRAMEHTGQLLAGVERLNAQDYKGAITAFDTLAADERSSYYAPAMLHKAQAQKASGDEEAAAKTYAQLAAHEGVLSDLAKLQVKDAGLTKDSPFSHTQRELDAWRLLEQGKKEEAAALMIALRDDEQVPRSQRERMAQLIQHLMPGAAPSSVEPAHE